MSDITQHDSNVAFAITVPSSGDYLVDIFYNNSQGAVAEQRLQVDNEAWVQVAYPPNVGPQFIDKQSMVLSLAAGAHTITLAPSSAVPGGARLAVDLDKLDLPRLTATSRIKRYDAEYATLAGGAVVRSDNAGYSGTGYVGGYNGSDAASTHFVVSVAANAFYDIALRYAAGALDDAPADRTVRMVVSDSLARDVSCPGTAAWDVWATTTTTVFLQAGINRIAFQAYAGGNRSAIHVDYIEVAPGSGGVDTYGAEAPGNTLGGTAAVAHDPYASGQQYVGGIGNGAANYLQFNNVQAAAAGLYKMVVRYANAEKIGAHDYNVNVVDRGAEISVNAGRATTVYFRNTFGWNAYRTTVVDVQLEAGSNTIRFSNGVAHAPTIDMIEIAMIAPHSGSIFALTQP
ncbi:MAG: hypothetical protein H7Y32_10875 [Chloroflexales bacterium]|nr:hypothetical protein [Chloroflexales bacterium]